MGGIGIREEQIMLWKMIKIILLFQRKCKRDNISAYAAQSAFFILLSAIPFLMMFSSLLQYTPVTEGMVMVIAKRTIPDYIAPFCISIIHEVYNKSVGIISVTAILAVWSAAKGVQYIANGLNAVNGIYETRSWFVLRFWAIIHTVIFVLAIIGTLLLLVFGNSVQKLIVKYIPLIGHITHMIIRLRGFLLLGLFILFFAVVFKTLPNRKVKLRLQLPGAILCAVAWYVFSFGLSVYVNYFNGFSMYGSLTTIVLIMLWLYFCMYIMLLCAEINVVFQDVFEGWFAKRQERRTQKRLEV